MSEREEGFTSDPTRDAEEMSEREIDENLAGTFPASDPPSWTLGTDHAARPDDEPSDN